MPHIRYGQCMPGATWANARGYSGPLSFAYKQFDGWCPSRALLEKVEAGF